MQRLARLYTCVLRILPGVMTRLEREVWWHRAEEFTLFTSPEETKVEQHGFSDAWRRVAGPCPSTIHIVRAEITAPRHCTCRVQAGRGNARLRPHFMGSFLGGFGAIQKRSKLRRLERGTCERELLFVCWLSANFYLLLICVMIVRWSFKFQLSKP